VWSSGRKRTHRETPLESLRFFVEDDVAWYYGIGDYTRMQKGGSMRVKLPA
jgi:hypothetical protein